MLLRAEPGVAAQLALMPPVVAAVRVASPTQAPLQALMPPAAMVEG